MHLLRSLVWKKAKLHHHIQKPEPVSGFFTSACSASSGGPSRIRLASGTPPVFAHWALFGLSVLRFSLLASRACARSLPVLARISGWSVVVGKWLLPATDDEIAPNHLWRRPDSHLRSAVGRTLKGLLDSKTCRMAYFSHSAIPVTRYWQGLRRLPSTVRPCQ